MQGLVDNVTKMITETGSNPAAFATVNARVTRELSALQKLVNASIVALKYVLRPRGAGSWC